MVTQLPVRPETRGKVTEGFCTPKEDKTPQRVNVLPNRVLPIVFLPGIMGSNLRMSRQRQNRLGKKNNIAWRPDRPGEAVGLLNAEPATRQLQLDPATTEVDTYDDGRGPTGDSSESGHERHDVGNIKVPLRLNINTPLLIDDPVTAKPWRSKEEKARARGWGEIFLDSYREILEICETRLNDTSIGWESIVNIDPTRWQAHNSPELHAISKEELSLATLGCWFPVHAMGYNWLRSCGTAAIVIAKRIEKLISSYQAHGYQCEKVIIVTHSMGGLVARALIHPAIGKMAERVLGIVHGVMPATGAPAAYKRMRCGFEEGALGIAPAPKVLGNSGDEVTAVLANSPGALELLPGEAYGNGWLQIKHYPMLATLPKNGDPYEEIYKLRGKWYGLLREEWINPAQLDNRGFDRSCEYLDAAKQFHREIASSYHGNSFAHYGAETSRPSWQYVTWEFATRHRADDWRNLEIDEDNAQGELILRFAGQRAKTAGRRYPVQLGKPVGAGDETVPAHSADHQLRSRMFKGVFRQTGYEHQSSYSDKNAVSSTLFSLIRIIQTMKWEGKC